jgi:photosystem II stability/assembly factor-like uncharacterized protein
MRRTILTACAVLVPLLCGCGSLARLTGGTTQGVVPRATDSGSRQTASSRQLVGSFVASVNPRTGALTFAPDTAAGGGKARGLRKHRGVRLQSTRFGPVDKLSLTGTAVYDAGAGLVRGNVTVGSTNRFPFSDVKAIILSISSTTVTVQNENGTTNLAGPTAPFFDHGTVSGTSPSTKEWQFSNASGVSFTFRVQLFANVWTYSIADGGALGGIHFIDATTGVAVGVGGKIFRTTDGGASWQGQNPGTTRNLNDVFFVDASQGWAVGDNGTILRTTNAGRSWEPQTSSATAPLYGVRFADANRGWIVGGIDPTAGVSTVLRTTNGGATWTPITSGLTDANLFALDATGNGGSQLTAVGEAGVIVRSTDDGLNWELQSPPAGLSPTANLQSVDFVNVNRGWAVGSLGAAIFTNDGGATWSLLPVPTGTANLNGVSFVDANAGWIVGRDGIVLKTTNGGANWTGQATPSGTGDLGAIATLIGDTQRAWTVGAGGALLSTSNGGTTWARTSAASRSLMYAVDFSDSLHGWAVGDNGTMLRTLDAGAHWSKMTGIDTATMTGVDFVNEFNGWAVGTGTTVLRTANGGGSWVQLPVSASVAAAFSGVKFIDGSNGIVVGYGTHGTSGGLPFITGLYLRTANGGNNWVVRPDPMQGHPALPPLNAVDFADDSVGWIVGSSGTIRKTTDGGATWAPQTVPALQNLYAVKAIDTTHACAVGQGGVIFRTDDGGATWVSQFSPVSVDLNGVEFVDLQRGWAVGSTRTVSEGGTMVLRETVLRTTNGGATWTPVETNTNVALKGIRFVSPDDGWIVGANGLVKRFN